MNKLKSLRVTRMIVITSLFLLPYAYSHGQQREIGRFELVDSTYYVEKNGLMSSNANSLSKTGRPNIYIWRMRKIVGTKSSKDDWFLLKPIHK